VSRRTLRLHLQGQGDGPGDGEARFLSQPSERVGHALTALRHGGTQGGDAAELCRDFAWTAGVSGRRQRLG